MTSKPAAKPRPAKDKGRPVVAKLNRALERLVVEYVPIDSIQPNQYNPNRQSEHEFELLMRSMREDGFTQPIIVHKETRRIVDGEHRWRAAAKLGLVEVPVVMTDMTPEQMRIATLRHNRARGTEDIDLSAQVLRDLQSLGALAWAQDSLMLDDVEVNRLLDSLPAPEALQGESYGEAWEPGLAGVHDKDTEATMTPAALEARRDTEKRLREATTQSEREAVRKELALFRLNVTFTDAEAETVKAVLGTTPAVRILELCRAEQARR